MPPTPPLTKSSNPLNPGTSDPAVRAAKARLQTIIRDDWKYPPEPNSTVPTLPYSENQILEWREREYETSLGSDSESSSSREVVKTNIDPYKYESPDAIHVESIAEDRRRKRRRKERDEMRWNDGLRIWSARRDLWCGARDRRKLHSGNPHTTSTIDDIDGEDERNDTLAPLEPIPTNASHVSHGSALTLTISNTSALHRPLTNASTASNATTITITPLSGLASPFHEKGDANENDLSLSDLLDGGSSSPFPDPDASPPPSAYHDAYSTPAHIPVPPPDVLLPLPPSLLPSASNPIRASITTATYPKIYSAVVVQGLTPTVPINLKDVTGALVQGWKGEGNWPPKSTAPPPEIAVTKKKGKKGAKVDAAEVKTGGVGGGAGGNGKVRKSVEVMRKALGIGGVS
jgi:hypothetical protein